MSKTKTWEQQQLGRCVKAVRDRMGPGAWDMLGWRMREALVRAEALTIIANSDAFESTPQGRLAVLACQWGEEE